MKKVDDSKNWKTTVLGIGVFIYEVILFFLFLVEWVHPLFLLIFHMALVGFLVRYVYHCFNKHEDLRFPFLLLISVFGLGPFGAAGFLLLSILYPLYRKSATPPSVWFADLFPEEEILLFGKIYQRVKSGWDDYSQPNEVDSFQDLFNHGALSQKQAVLDAIVKDFNPTYAPILKQALNDTQNTVRIQAAAIVAKIDDEFAMKQTQLLEEEEEEPGKPEHLLKIAEHIDTYVSAGLQDISTLKRLTAKAIDYYQKYLQLKPDDLRTWFAIGKLLFNQKDYEHFLIWCDDYRKEHRDLPRLFHSWHLEALYRLHRYEELADHAGGL